MSENTKSDAISRRTALSLLGLAAAFSLAVPATVLTVSDAEAQQTPAPEGEKTGTERRHERREHRGERRHGRHEHREERRHGRHEHREERRHERHKHRKERRDNT